MRCLGWSLWSKDIILVIPPDSFAGPQAWVDAYHDAHDPSRVDSLPIKSGALQGAIALDYVQERHFQSVHIVYDGVNGQLPNLDLINSVVHVAGGQMGMGVALQEMYDHDNQYPDRLRTMLRGMLKQGLGMASGPHSSFMPYHVDAVTLQPFGEGWQDEMAMGRVVEGTFRSLNNLLEHLHQSFFFYLIMHKERFVSIGTYLPSAMLVAANFTIMAIALWVKSGQPEAAAAAEKKDGGGAEESSDAMSLPAVERDIFLPIGFVAVCQFLGVVPLYLFHHTPSSVSSLGQPILKSPSFFFLLGREADRLLAFPAAYRCLRRLRRPERGPPARPLPPPDVRLPALGAAVPADEVLLAAAAGHVPLLARNAQLLPCLPRRPASLPAVLHAAVAALAGHALGVHRAAQRRRRAHGRAAHLQPRLGAGHRLGAAAGGLRVGRLGHVHLARRLVRVVARLARRLGAGPRGARGKGEGEDCVARHVKSRVPAQEFSGY